MTHDNTPTGQNSGGELEDDVQWTPVATAPDQLTAEMWQQLLRQESVASMLAPQDAVSFMGLAATPVRLMVPVETLARAREILAGILDDPASTETDEA